MGRLPARGERVGDCGGAKASRRGPTPVSGSGRRPTFLRGLCCNGVQGVAVDVGSVAVELGTVISLVVSPGVVGGGTVVVMPTVDREALVAGAVVAA
jgi:hypothetical protein